MLFSEKFTDPDEKSYCACGNSSRPSLLDPDEKSYCACGNSSRPSLFVKVPLLGETELL